LTIITPNLILEILAVLSALTYIILASKQNYFCWPMSLLSCIIYAWLCYGVQLYLESFLQTFYFIVALYGWYFWKIPANSLNVSYQSVNTNISVSIILLFAGLILGYFAHIYSSAALPYIDSVIFLFSIYATYITALKKIESWLYWIVINSISVFIYFSRGLYITSFLYLLYALLAVQGFMNWRKSWHTQHNIQL